MVGIANVQQQPQYFMRVENRCVYICYICRVRQKEHESSVGENKSNDKGEDELKHKFKLDRGKRSQYIEGSMLENLLRVGKK